MNKWLVWAAIIIILIVVGIFIFKGSDSSTSVEDTQTEESGTTQTYPDGETVQALDSNDDSLEEIDSALEFID